MKLYPSMINLTGKKVVVIGGGNVAYRKIVDLLECGAHITIISPEIIEQITDLTVKHSIKIIKRPYKKGDIKKAFLVIAATNDTQVNTLILHEAEKSNTLINSVDDPEHCNYFVPSYFRKGDLLVAVSTNGTAPSLAAKIRREFENYVDPDIEIILPFINRIRDLLKNDTDFSGLSYKERAIIINKITGNQLLKDILQNNKTDKDLKSYINKLID